LRALVNTVMNLPVTQCAENVLTNQDDISFSKWILLHGVKVYSTVNKILIMSVSLLPNFVSVSVKFTRNIPICLCLGHR
jgi:hypothetical protein